MSTCLEAPITLHDARHRAIEEEQPYVTGLYQQLDALRERTAARLAEIYQQAGWDEGSIWERDVFAARDLQRLQRLDKVDRGLCFGRLDLRDDERRYIGRIGLSDDEYDQLLIDWRAPAAEPFYRATAADPGDVVRRRHIQTKRRRVIGVDDEVFDAGAVSGETQATLSGEAALLATLNEARTGRMSDIVATIQAEQDRVIRADARGILVVQGAPGTGKTVAALHRAAYLLYTHRERLANSGVLVLGPNRTFLRYIDQVLPSLGETGVVLSTVAELYPDVDVVGDEPDDTVALAKGAESMAKVIVSAVKKHERTLKQPVHVVVDDVTLVLEPSVARNARERARRSRRPHNAARAVFDREILTELARQYAQQIAGLDDDDDLTDIRFELSGDDDVQALLNQLWPTLTPEALLRALYASDNSAPWFRRNGAAWTSADVPLLDEAAVVLGDAPDDAALAAERRQEAERRAETDFARDLLGELELSIPVDATGVAARYRGVSSARPVNERAAGDRDWAFGHVIVDEAQELSPMAWRMVMRRVPSKSLTVVGDVAQTGAAAGTRSWGSVFDGLAPGRWREETLTINYRTPAEIMDVGAAVLSAIDPSLAPPQSVRSEGAQPWTLSVSSARLTEELADAVTAELKAIEGGLVAVLVPVGDDAEVRVGLESMLPAGTVGAGSSRDLDAPVTVLTVRQAKGLEFDSVIVVEPSAIVSRSGRSGESAERGTSTAVERDQQARGLTDLYVAVTRPTRRLGIVHTGDLPAPLRTTVPAA